MSQKRFDCFFEKHFGFGIRWDSFQYPLHLSIAIPFITFAIGFGAYKQDDTIAEQVAWKEEEIERLRWQSELSSWLIKHQCHVLQDSVSRAANFACIDIDGDVIGRSVDYYGAIVNARSNSMT